MSPLSGQWKRAGAWLRGYLSERWERLLAWRGRWLPREETFHLMLAGLVGIVGGLTNAFFHYATRALRLLAMGLTGDPVEIAVELTPAMRLVVPTLGALLAGLILRWGQRYLQGRGGATNLLEVVVAGDGRLPFRPNLIKAASSLLSVASGASIGREGPITQMSATLASKLGQTALWPPYRLRLLVACGAAAGMAAAYNAPIAGSVFAAQIVLGNFSMNLFAPLMFASVTAAVVSRTFFGIEPWYSVPEFEFTRILQLPWFVVLGALAGVLAASFLRLLQAAERIFQRLGQPIQVRLTMAGLAVGGLAVVIPEVWGNGYSVTSRILQNAPQYGIAWLSLLLLAKVGTTVLTVGAGTVGGVFTPTLFLGAALGSLFGQILHVLGLADSLPVGAFALAGMGSVLAATTHSPLLALIMVFEISLNYSLMPALMLACAVGTLVSRQLHANSVYTEPLQRRGLLGEAEPDQLGAATQGKIGDFMREPVPPVNETATFKELGQRFLTSPNNFLPVVDDRGRLTGLVALQDLKGYLNAGQELQAVIAYDVMRPPPACVTPNQLLHEALPVLLATELRHIPVVNTLAERRLVGSLARAEALSALSEALAPKGTAKN
ncbi:MAG: ClcB-like voltage-gated chloride channel protein [Verrucomicrobiales bacterium]|nr:ClcB-like voltage-gated chloride channel protein [Verrucomicrobiales bacterium]